MINETFSSAYFSNHSQILSEDSNYIFLKTNSISLEKQRLEACGSPNASNLTLLSDFRYYGCGITISILATAGTIGNILSFITIATLPKRNLFNKLLLTLTVYDTLFIVNGGLFMVQQAVQFNNSIYNMFLPWFIYPVAGIAMTGSTYTCIAIAFERFLGICYAHSDIPRHSRYYILAITCISLLIDFPRFFEIGGWKEEKGRVIFTFSELRKNELYLTFYILWFRLFSTAAVPFILMLFFNFKILKHYRRNTFINNQNSNSFNNNSHEKSLYITFFCLTTTFLICHLPRVLLNIHELNKNRLQNYCRKEFGSNYNQPAWSSYATLLEKILLIFNSSVNFIFYCLAGKSFRRHLIQLLLPKWCISRFFPSVSSALERGSLMDSLRNHPPVHNRHSSVRRGTLDYVISHPVKQGGTLILDSVGDEEEGHIILEEEEEEDDEGGPSLIGEEVAGEAERLLGGVRIQEKQQTMTDKGRSELKIFKESSSSSLLNSRDSGLSVLQNERPSKGTTTPENELLGIYDIRITIHRKHLGTAI